MFGIDFILIIANSGRMLAEFSKNQGYTPIVIDLFADSDTRNFTAKCIKIKSLKVEYVKKAVIEIITQYPIKFTVYGSGLEKNQNSLDYLYQISHVLGNSLAVFSAIQNKVRFFKKLDALKIPYPQTSFQQPEKNQQWLIKPIRGEGGVGIKNYNSATKTSGEYYWQQYIAGTPMSVLFLADGKNFSICGFQKQLTVLIADNEFVFAGVISLNELDEKIQIEVTTWLTNLVSEFSLIGLNSLDFMMTDSQCYLLEINARPTASMQLYDDSILLAHIKTCLSGKLKAVVSSDVIQAYQVIFSEQDLKIKQGLIWPVWVKDIPLSGVLINTGMPICSIIASGKTEQQVEGILVSRQKIIMNFLI